MAYPLHRGHVSSELAQPPLPLDSGFAVQLVLRHILLLPGLAARSPSSHKLPHMASHIMNTS